MKACKTVHNGDHSSIVAPPVASFKSRSLELDFVRGLAILMVMSYHFEQAPRGYFVLHALQTPGKMFGETGVDLFFILSGFLVGGLLLMEYKVTGQVRTKRFLLRRGMKIWPAYYCFILIEVIGHKHPLHTFLLPNLFHIQNYLGTSISHTWTLSLEEHFYLLLAISMAFMTGAKWSPGKILNAFLCTIGGTIIVRSFTVFMGWPGAWNYTHNRLDSLLLGVVLATLLHFYPDRFDQIARKTWLLAAAAIFAVAFHCLFPSDNVTNSIGFTILYLGYGSFILLVYRHSGRIRDSIAYRSIAGIGVYSYGIYLWHNSVRAPLVQLATHYPGAIRWYLLAVSEYTGAIVLGIMATLLIEWPFLKIRERMFPKEGLSSAAVPLDADKAATGRVLAISQS